jgi:hypothetical protein
MEYSCQHCNVNLDEGDILEYFLLKYDDYEKAIKYSRQYGWSDTNKIHFNRSIIVQPNKGLQYTICPDCKKKDPFPKKCVK